MGKRANDIGLVLPHETFSSCKAEPTKSTFGATRLVAWWQAYWRRWFANELLNPEDEQLDGR